MAAETDRQTELERLRARVAALEAELVESGGAHNAVVAAAQERAYWLDRWHLDLNALMQRPGAAEFRAAAARASRWVLRGAQQVKRRSCAHREPASRS